MDDIKLAAAQTAREWLAARPLFLDTETTGLSPTDEVCQVAVLDAAGHVLLESLVKPRLPIGEEARRVHGITDEMVAAAPPLDMLFPVLSYLLCERVVVTFNAAFDSRMIRQSLPTIDPVFQRIHWRCAMLLYAKFHGESDPRFGNWRWQKLGQAAQQCQIDVPGDLHGARVDAEVARRVLEHVARWQPPETAKATD